VPLGISAPMELAAHRTTYYHAKNRRAAGQAFGPFRTMTDSQSGNAAGRPKGSKQRLAESFIAAPVVRLERAWRGCDREGPSGTAGGLLEDHCLDHSQGSECQGMQP
jgi:hypothetical protein